MTLDIPLLLSSAGFVAVLLGGLGLVIYVVRDVVAPQKNLTVRFRNTCIFLLVLSLLLLLLTMGSLTIWSTES